MTTCYYMTEIKHWRPMLSNSSLAHRRTQASSWKYTVIIHQSFVHVYNSWTWNVLCFFRHQISFLLLACPKNRTVWNPDCENSETQMAIWFLVLYFEHHSQKQYWEISWLTSHFVWLKTSCFFSRTPKTDPSWTHLQPTRVWYPPEDVIPAIFEVWLFNLGAYVSQAGGYIFAFVIWEAMAGCISWTSVGRTQRRVDWICIGCVYFFLAG